MKQVDIGLDIGIASVGWCITTRDDSHEIIKHGVRLFNSVDDPKDSKLLNEKRRDARSARRQVQRRVTRRRDFFKLLITYKLSDIEADYEGKFVEKSLDKFIRNVEWLKEIDKEHQGLGIFYLRKKGMTNKLTLIELINVLYWYINHRGFKYETLESKKDDVRSKYKEYLETSETPVNVQLDYYKKNGYLNGSINRVFKTIEYEQELKQIISQQNLDSKFIQEYLELFNRQRSFEIGPGNENTKTPYGLYYDKINKDIIKREIPYTTIWEKTIGRCSIYVEEYRAPRKSLSAELFNLLNDLNNLTISNQKLAKDHKFEIVKIALKTENHLNKTIKYLEKTFELEDNSNLISGFRIDKKNKKQITELSAFHLINKHLRIKDFFNEIFLNKIFNFENIYDKISNIFNQTMLIDTRVKKLQELNLNLNELQIKELSQLGGFSETHSLSFKALKEFILIMFEESKNQSQIRSEKSIDKTAKFKIKNYLEASWAEDRITNPVVKRSLRQALKVLNAIFQFCEGQYEIRDIVVEMAREANNKDARDLKIQLQNIREKTNQQIKSYIEYLNGEQKPQNILKIWLWMQQKGYDAYTGEKLDINEIFNQCDIDHIVPYSQSFDDSRANKVLTKKTINSKKGNKSSYQFLTSIGMFDEMFKMYEDWYSPYLNTNDREVFASSRKLENLKSELDYSKPENQIGFIQRNLVDTRYATKALIEYLSLFKQTNNLNWKVKTINGKMTNFVRKKMDNKINRLDRPDDCGESFDEKTGEKNRIWHGHHAEDAYIITLLNYFYKDQKTIEFALSQPEISPYNGITDQNLKKQLDAQINTNFEDFVAQIDIAREELNKKMSNVKFSRMIEKKDNKELFNETLYKGKMQINPKTNKEELVKSDYLILLEADQKKLSNFFGDNPPKKESLDIYRCDRKAYNALNEIYMQNSNKEKPFNEAKENAKTQYVEISYLTSNGNHVQRIIKKLRYLDSFKKESDIVFAPKNNKSFYESFKWLRLEIYKNNKDKWKIIPITAKNSTFGDLKKEQSQNLIEQKTNFDIDVNAKPFLVLNKYDCLINNIDGTIWYVVGHIFSHDKLELKPIWRGKLQCENRFIVSINTFLKGWNLVKLSILGNIKVEFFKF